MLAPIVSELRHVQKYFISALVGHAARHYPRRRCLKIFTDQILEVFYVFFWSPATIFLLLAFVAFCEHKCHGNLVLTKPTSIVKINLLSRNTRIYKEKNRHQIISAEEVISSKCIPIFTSFLWRRGISITRQVNKVPAVIYFEMIDTLGLARLLGGERETLAADDRVEQGRLADVGAADESELRQPIPGTVIGSHAALHKIRGNNLGIAARVRAQHDVGALEDPPGDGLLVPGGHVRPRWQEEPVERKLYLHLPQWLLDVGVVYRSGALGIGVVYRSGVLGIGAV